MLHKFCRLCLNSERLIHTFDNHLSAQEGLRTCILLCTGVNIQETDKVSKYVCHDCCISAVNFFKYRKIAIANDKALKEYIGQEYNESASCNEEVTKLHFTILNKISKTDITQSIKTLYDLYDNNVIPHNNNNNIKRETTYEKYAVHPSIMKLYKVHPRLIIPNDILKSNIEPTLVLDRQLVDGWEFLKEENEDTCNLDDIDTFKLKFPDINITGIPATKCETTPKKEQNDERDVVVTQPIEQAKLHSLSTILNADCNLKEKKRKRSDSESRKNKKIFTKESRSLQKVRLPECIPADTEVEKALLTSSLEVTVSNTDKSDIRPNKNENNLLQPITKKVLLICRLCNKVYQSKAQLKSHKRLHRKCRTCRTVLISPDALPVHSKEVCLKTIAENQPNILLRRIDEIPDEVARYRDAFDYYFASFKMPKEETSSFIEPSSKNMAQTLCDGQPCDDKCVSHDDDVPMKNNEAQVTGKSHSMEENIDYEHEYVTNIFNKYKTCNNFSHTCRQKNCIRYSKQNHIVLENMYSDLMIYKVPLEMIVSPKISVHVSYTNKTKVTEPAFSWSEFKVHDLVTPMNL